MASLGGPPLMPASQAESGDERAAPVRMDGPVRAGRRRSATASPTFACSQQVPPAGAGGERCLPRCPRGPRRMGWPGHVGTDEARATWALPIGCNSHGPRATVSLIRQSDLLLLLCGLLAPLALSLSRAHLPLPTKFLISREPQRAGLRAVVGPCLPRNWEPCMPEARDPR